MAENANTPPHNLGSPAAEDSEALDDNEQELTGPSLDFALVEDLSRKNQLSSVRKPPPPPGKPRHYRPNERQLLQEGKRWDSEIFARLKQVEFGTFKGETACLVVVQVDFAPKKGGFFSFRSATVEVGFEEEANGKEEQGNGKEDEDEDEDDEDYDDEDDDDDEDGPLVLKLYPESIRGHIQTIAETVGITIAANLTASAITAGEVSTGWGVSSREAQDLVLGGLVGSPERGVKWTINENEASKSGIYHQPIFAAIVRYREERGFVMTLTVKATTDAGLAVMGKEGSSIKFTGGKERQEKAGRSHKMSGLVGGSIASGGKTWTAEKDSEPSQQLLEELDLESLTGMKVKLLSEQGPSCQ